mgnify:CR=1 FL=1|jgi:glycosyltransferase involved in cell wall biosynthesis
MYSPILKKKPLISVIINCFDGEKFLSKCIKSVLSQSYQNWEIIFFNNNSSDQSVKILNSFRDRRIKLFNNNKKKNFKLYKARNIAISKAKGKYITFLDTDDLWKKNKLKKQIELINKNPEVNIIYSNYYIIEEEKKKIYLKHKKKLPSGFITQELLNDYKIGILTLLVSKKIFSHYKFKDKYSIIGDFDYMINLSRKFNITAIQEPLAFYRIHQSNLSSKRLDLFAKELKNWINYNKFKLLKQGFNLKKIEFYLFKLKVKMFLKNNFNFKF